MGEKNNSEIYKNFKKGSNYTATQTTTVTTYSTIY